MKASFVEQTVGKMLENNDFPWLHQMKQGESMPYNPVTGKSFAGMNAFALMMAGKENGYDDPRWMTYRQAERVGAQVMEGEKGTAVQLFALRDKDGSPLAQPRPYVTTVFNAAQIEGLPLEREAALSLQKEAEIKAKLSQLVIASGYDKPDQPESRLVEALAAKAAREVGGHRQPAPTGSTEYALENIRIQMAAMRLGCEMGIGANETAPHALEPECVNAIRKDPNSISRAAADADKIAGHVRKYWAQDLTQPLPAPLEPAQRKAASKNTYIDVPYGDINAAKEMGAQWAPARKSWFIPEGVDPEPFTAKWPEHDPPVKIHQAYTYIDVPYEDINAAKEMGAQWAPARESWFIPEGVDHEPFTAKWPEHDPPIKDISVRSYINVPYEDAGAAKEMGARWDSRNKSWFIPAGIEAEPLLAKFPERDPVPARQPESTREETLADLAAEKEKRENAWYAKIQGNMDAAAGAVHAKIMSSDFRSTTPFDKHPGLEKMGLKSASSGAYINEKSGELAIPAFDLNTDEIRNAVYISKDGECSREKGGQIKDCALVIGGRLDNLAKADTASIIVTEDYATARSLSDATKHPVLVPLCQDATGMESSLSKLQRKFPGKGIVVALNNENPDKDRHSSDDPSKREVAEAQGCEVLKPMNAATFSDMKNGKYGLSGIKTMLEQASGKALRRKEQAGMAAQALSKSQDRPVQEKQRTGRAM